MRSMGREPAPAAMGPAERCIVCQGRGVCALGGLPASVRARYHSASRIKVYDRGTSVFHQGHEATGLFILCAGWIKLAYVSRDGRTATVALAGPGALIGVAEVLMNDRYSVTAHVLETAELAFVDRAMFLQLLGDEPDLGGSLLKAMSREVGALRGELCETVAKLPSIDRLLHTLQNLAAANGREGADGTRISLPLTVQDLADRIGCSRQWTSRLLGSLEGQGFVRRRQGWIALSDRPPAVQPSTT